MTRAREKNYKHIIKYTGIFGSVEVLKILIGLIRNKLVAVILGPNGVGLMSLFNSTIKLLSDTTGLGLPTSAVREVSEAAETGDQQRLERSVQVVRRLSLLTALLGMVLCASFCSLFNKWTFTWGDHTLHYVLLSPVVGFLAITGGEMAILKGLRQLRTLARLSVYCVLIALFTAVPLFYLWKESAIVPVLILTELLQLFATVGFSYRLIPLRLGRVGDMRPACRSMLTLGLAFVVSGLFTSGADFLIRSYLNNVASLEVVGLFNAGFVMVSVYGGMVFSAMSTDYFPRISAISREGSELNMMVNEQIEVTVLLVAPLLVFMMVSMPLLLPLLYSNGFLPVIGMVQVCLLSLYFRAVYMPIEYIALARARSAVFLTQEIVATLFLLGCFLVGYEHGFLWGAGLGISIAYALETLFVVVFARIKFGFHLSIRAVRYLSVQLFFGLVATLATQLLSGACYWLAGILMCLVSAAYSLRLVKRNVVISSRFTFVKKIFRQ